VVVGISAWSLWLPVASARPALQSPRLTHRVFGRVASSRIAAARCPEVSSRSSDFGCTTSCDAILACGKVKALAVSARRAPAPTQCAGMCAGHRSPQPPNNSSKPTPLRGAA
jgi:hypothetical protein